MVISNVIGVGVFASLGLQLLQFESTFVLMSLWVVGGVIAICGALTYAELGSRFPKSGGEYNYIREILHPSLGFVAGFQTIVIGFAAPIALVAMLFGKYLHSALPVVPETESAVFLLFICTIFHLFNYRTSSTSIQGFTTIKVLLILAFCLVCLFLTAERQEISMVPGVEDLELIFTGGYALALVFTYYSYAGWNAACYMSGDLRVDKGALTKSLVIGTSIVIFVYLLLNYTFLAVAPIDAMKGNEEIGVIVAKHAVGDTGGVLMGVALALMLIATANAMTLAGSRVAQRIGEDEQLLSFLARRNKHYIPWVAVTVQAILALGFILSESFEAVLVFAGTLIAISNIMTVLCIFKVRRENSGLTGGYRVPLYPLPPIVFLLIVCFFLVYLFSAEFWNSVIAIACWVIGLGIFWILRLGTAFRYKVDEGI